jgi:hypothetical protein
VRGLRLRQVPAAAALVVRRRASAPVIPAVPAGSWLAAGNRFFKRVMVPPVPVRAYTKKITGVPLTGGQAAGVVPASGALTLQVGPQGLGTMWYPAQVTLSTTAGPLDSSTATVYLGVGGVPTTQVGTLFPGNGVLALAVPPLQPGDNLIVAWAGAVVGEVAALNIIGTQDALGTP